MKKLNHDIPNRIKREINRIRHNPNPNFFMFDNSVEKYGSGACSRVALIKNCNLAVKKQWYYPDPQSLIFAKIAQSKCKTNPLFPVVYHIENDMIFMEKLSYLDDDDTYRIKEDLSSRLAYGKINLNEFEREILTDIRYIIKNHGGVYDAFENNISFRLDKGKYHPVIFDPILPETG